MSLHHFRYLLAFSFFNSCWPLFLIVLSNSIVLHSPCHSLINHSSIHSQESRSRSYIFVFIPILYFEYTLRLVSHHFVFLLLFSYLCCQMYLIVASDLSFYIHFLINYSFADRFLHVQESRTINMMCPILQIIIVWSIQIYDPFQLIFGHFFISYVVFEVCPFLSISSPAIIL